MVQAHQAQPFEPVRDRHYLKSNPRYCRAHCLARLQVLFQACPRRFPTIRGISRSTRRPTFQRVLHLAILLHPRFQLSVHRLACRPSIAIEYRTLWIARISIACREHERWFSFTELNADRQFAPAILLALFANTLFANRKFASELDRNSPSCDAWDADAN